MGQNLYILLASLEVYFLTTAKRWKCVRPSHKAIEEKQATKCRGNAKKMLRGEINKADLLTRTQTAEFYETGIMYPENMCVSELCVGTVSKGIHIREEYLPVLLMEDIFLRCGKQNRLEAACRS